MNQPQAKKKIVFLGTPDFAVPSLRALVNADDIEVLAVITQPDKAVGRKQTITPPPVKVYAEEQGIKVYQPEKISLDEQLVKDLIALQLDFLVTVAYGQILKPNILDIAPVVNLHGSLLPEFRGPAPMNWMIIHGDQVVGLTTMLAELGVDTGAMLLKSQTDLGVNETSEELAERLAEVGAELLLKTLREFDSIKQQIQTSITSSRQLAPFMDKNLGRIVFSDIELILGSANPKQSEFKVILQNSAQNIHNLVRGTYPWPGASFMDEDLHVIVLETKVIDLDTVNASPGVIHSINKVAGSFTVQCQQGLLEILRVKPQGKNEMKALDWLNGRRLKIGDKI